MLYWFYENDHKKFIERLLSAKLVLLAMSFLLLGVVSQAHIDLKFSLWEISIKMEILDN